jgi:hypothetical protein
MSDLDDIEHERLHVGNAIAKLCEVHDELAHAYSITRRGTIPELIVAAIEVRAAVEHEWRVLGLLAAVEEHDR